MGWYPRPGEVVTDREGTHFELADEIARGGQGVVYATQAQGAAVKISLSATGTRRDLVEAQIRRVARLPISDLPVAFPRHTLEDPAVGYTMTLLTGMVPAEALMRCSRRPLVDWYIASGGLRKRLRVLAAAADLLGALHSRGLVYGDLSGNNVLISEHRERSRVFLIDLDNLQYCDAPPRRIFTADYAAPEQPEGATQATDRFSLAVFAYCLLAATNPYYGRQLHELPPEEHPPGPWSAVLAHIDMPGNTENSPVTGIPRRLVLSKRLERLFQRSFEDGPWKSEQRPTPNQWASAARSAYLASARCGCGWDNYASAAHCPHCDEPTRFRRFGLQELVGGSLRPFELCRVLVLGSEPVSIPAAALGLIAEEGMPAAQLQSHQGSVVLELAHPDLVFVDHPAARRRRLDGADGVMIGRARRSPIVLRPSWGHP